MSDLSEKFADLVDMYPPTLLDIAEKDKGMEETKQEAKEEELDLSDYPDLEVSMLIKH